MTKWLRPQICFHSSSHCSHFLLFRKYLEARCLALFSDWLSNKTFKTYCKTAKTVSFQILPRQWKNSELPDSSKTAKTVSFQILPKQRKQLLLLLSVITKVIRIIYYVYSNIFVWCLSLSSPSELHTGRVQIHSLKQWASRFFQSSLSGNNSKNSFCGVNHFVIESSHQTVSCRVHGERFKFQIHTWREG
jgi:hypothetical protein